MEPFKNVFSYPNALRIAAALGRVHPEFPIRKFKHGLQSSLEPLELKQRMHLIADRIEACIPLDPPQLFHRLVLSLAKDDSDQTGLKGFLVWPLTEIVARRGMPFFDHSMQALQAMTSQFTAEFAIRPFLLAQPGPTLLQLQKWCSHPDPHVRRLVSEGSRPLLPWGIRLPEILNNPTLTLGLLEELYQDPSPYVRLSVSNHLNDFSKHHSALIVKTLRRWQKTNPASPTLTKLIRHASRTLIKQGDPAALALHGYHSPESISLESSTLATPVVPLGGKLGYRLTTRNTSQKTLPVLFDYAIFHRKANGTLTPKVFKGCTRILAAGQSWDIEGLHSFRTITTRVYHPGVHHFEPRINGKPFPATEFLLKL